MPFQKGNKIRLGRKHSEETKRKIKESHLGLLSGNKHPMWGKKHSLETIAKIRESQSGSKNHNWGKRGIETAMYGKHHSKETKRKIGESEKGFYLKHPETTRIKKERFTGSKNPRWKGNKAGYIALHRWVRKIKPQPDACENCGSVTKKLILANRDHSAGWKTLERYNRDPNTYYYICTKCAPILDGRLEKARLARIGSHHSLKSKLKMSESQKARFTRD